MGLDNSLAEQNIRFVKDEPMSAHTTFRVGGNADYFILPANTDELKASVNICKKEGIPFRVIGKGSNLLVRDAGVRGAVICTEGLNNIELDGNTIKTGAGAMLSAVAMKACEAGLAGFDFAYGIPGTVGGAVVMNAGAYGGEIKDVIKSAEVIGRDGSMKILSLEELELSYRHSCIEDNDYIVLNAIFECESGNTEEIRALMDEHMQARKDKQPIEYPSAGSTFKRPEGYFAGKLIQDAGLKGYSVGDACVSEKHSGFVINRGRATASEVLAVIEHVKEKVMEDSGISLECEVKIL